MKVTPKSDGFGAVVTGIDLTRPLTNQQVSDLRAVWLGRVHSGARMQATATALAAHPTNSTTAKRLGVFASSHSFHNGSN